MTVFILQVLFFIAVAFGLGCLFGCWLKGRMGTAHHSGSAAAVTHEGAAKTVTAGELASPRPHYEPATSPQPAASVTSQPDAEAKAAVPAEAAAAPVKKAAKPKAAKSAAAKQAAGKSAKTSAAKSAVSKPRAAKAAGLAAAKTKADKPAAAKTAAAKPKAPKAKPAAATVPDNLKQIKGVGPAIETKLNAVGINSFAQIAAWTKKEQADFAEQLSFAGRIEREEWVSQAKILAKGGSTDFAKRVAKGEVASSTGGKPKRGK